MAESGIYEIVNLVNGKRYVGSAVDLDQRWREHRWGLKAGRHHSRHLQASWNKHGSQNFEFRVIRLCPVENLISEEQAEFDRRRPEYNICPVAGSTLGRPHTDDAKRKIGDRLRGSKRDPEVVERIASQLRGRSRPPEHSAHLIGNDHAKGHRHTDEWKSTNGERLRHQYETGIRSRSRPPEYRAKIAATLRSRGQDPEVRERMRQQAREQWERMTPEERVARMERVRAGCKRGA